MPAFFLSKSDVGSCPRHLVGDELKNAILFLVVIPDEPEMLQPYLLRAWRAYFHVVVTQHFFAILRAYGVLFDDAVI